MIKYFLTVILIILIIKIPYKKIIKKLFNNKNNEKKNTKTIENINNNQYQSKYLLTKNEWYEWKKLNAYATEKKYIICPKVRLLDIIEPISNADNYMSLLGKIQSKHIDFVICDQDLRIKGIIELDDNSHNKTKRKERDQFIDQILTQVGYKILHTRSITETTLDFIENKSTTQEQIQP